MAFSRQEYWSGLPFPALGELPKKGIEPAFLMCPALPGEFFTSVLPGEGKSWSHRVRHYWAHAAAAAAKSLQSCPTLCDPIDGNPPDSPVPGILQARTLEWVAISFSNAWKWKVKVKSLSRIQLLYIKSNQKRKYRKRDQLKWSLLPRRKHMCPCSFIYGYHSTMSTDTISQILYKSAVCLIKNDIC